MDTTALNWAAFDGHLGVVKALLSAKADVDAKNDVCHDILIIFYYFPLKQNPLFPFFFYDRWVKRP